MALFQQTHPREDTVPRRPLTDADIQFLTQLQSDLNTQDTMGNRDPRFWVIQQSSDISCPPDEADTVHVIQNSACEVIAHNLQDFLDHLQDRYYKYNIQIKHPDGAYFWHMKIVNMADEEFEDDHITDIDDVINLLARAGITDYSVSYSRKTTGPVQDTLFLTHKDCEDHLRKYSYNYHEDAHAFAMTADRSPRFAQLISLLQTVDFNALKPNER